VAGPNPARSPEPQAQTRRLDQQDYRLLADFRYLIRRFLEFSEIAAHGEGLTSRQHQALLAIKGFPGDRSPTVGELAERLRVQHHSAVELVDRLVEAGLIVRLHDPDDRRRVLLGLTDTAEHHLFRLSSIHLEELRRLKPVLQQIVDRAGTDAQ
jgi:DNA-binding MarR family transcriptional regulator